MTEKHIHKLRRLVHKSGNKIFFCALPDCNYKINVALALGKRSICWRCGEPFLITEYSLRLAKPHCDLCHKSKKEIEKYEGVPVTHETPDFLPSLSERLQQTLNQAKPEEEEDL